VRKHLESQRELRMVGLLQAVRSALYVGKLGLDTKRKKLFSDGLLGFVLLYMSDYFCRSLVLAEYH